MTVGFTAGIAVIIFASQIKDLLGLTLAGKEPGPLVAKVEALARSVDTINPAAVALALLVIALILGIRKLRPHWPGILIAVVVAAVASWAFALPVETIGSRFGGIPSLLPAPHLPAISFAKIQAVLPDAVAFALLGAIESLLSAVVADGMTGRRHRSNCELVAQGVANIASALFGGICVTGTIARTATNVRAGARGPVAGMMHSVFLLLFMMLAAPLASYVPLAALAGVLAIVAWNMAEKYEFLTLLRSSRGDAVVLLATFLLTVFRDLTEGIVVGFALGAVLFIKRMAGVTGIEAHAPLVASDRADEAGPRSPYDSRLATDSEVVVYRLSGAFFFGTASTLNAVLDRIADRHKAFVIDFSAVPFVDSTAANVIAGIARKAGRHDVRVFVTGATAAVRHVLLAAGARRPHVRYRANIEDAVREAHAPLGGATAFLCLALGGEAPEQRVAALVGREEAFDADFLQGDVLRRAQGGDGGEHRERLAAHEIVDRQHRCRPLLEAQLAERGRHVGIGHDLLDEGQRLGLAAVGQDLGIGRRDEMARDLLPVRRSWGAAPWDRAASAAGWRLARRRRRRRALEQEHGEGVGRLVGLQQVPQPVDDDGRIGLLLLQHAVDRLAHRRELGRAQVGLAIDRREARGQQHGVALAQRHVERGGELHHHLAAGPGAARIRGS